MPTALRSPRLVLGILGVIVLAAVILGVTKYKIPSISKTNSNTNQSLNTNTMASYPFSGVTDADVTNKQVRITTSKGDIIFSLDSAAGPLAAKNFYYLVMKGFYNGLTFHRVEDNFVIQGGDPQGTGMGGPGYQFADDPVNQAYTEGTVAMANSGPNSNGSQFFICKGTGCSGLAPSYSIFGHVTVGQDIVNTIAVGDVMTKVTIEPKS